MRNKYVANHLLNRDGNYYLVRRVPNDLKKLYTVKRLCFSLKTKSYSSAIRMIKSVVKQFLSTHNVSTKWSNRQDDMSTKDIYKIASKQTVMVVCRSE